MKDKTYHNTDVSKAKDNIPDIQVFGNGDMWKLLSKASSQKEGWMKSTKAMQIEYLGCLVQVTTQQGNNIAEAITFIPKAKIVEDKKNGGRRLEMDTITNL